MTKIIQNKKKMKKNKLKLNDKSDSSLPEHTKLKGSKKKIKKKASKFGVEKQENVNEKEGVVFENCGLENTAEDLINSNETLQPVDFAEENFQSTVCDKQTEKKKKIKGKSEQRSEASQHLSEFNLTEVGKEKVKLDELIKTSTKISGQVSAKKQLQSIKKLKSLSIPMSKPQLEKIKRTIAYDKVCEEVSKWDTIVKSNRDAEQMIYPLKKPEVHLESFEDVSERFISKHPVEEAVAEILKTSENVLDQKRMLTVAEEKALQAMSLEEAKQRHSELMKARALLSYQEAKARRQNKIKSKRYHRILKREKLKKMMQEFEQLQKTDQKAALEKFLEADKLRILERMTLKHRNTGKWAKQQKIRAKYNPESRSNLKEDLIIGRKLREKVVVDLPSTQNIVEEVDPEDRFFEDSADKFLIEDIPFGNSATEQSASDDTNNFMNSVSQKLLENSDSKKYNSKEKRNAVLHSTEKSISSGTDIAFMKPTDLITSMVPGEIVSGCDMDDAEEGEVPMSEAFADDDVIAEFEEEKKAAERANKPKQIDLFLPGWGSWGGPGVKTSRRKQKRFLIKPLEPASKKNTLGHVIINEESDKKAAEHQVNQLPFPFSNVHQFESHIRQPVGHTWNPQSSFQSLIAPKVVTKLGKIIDPIDSEDVVLKKKTRTTQPKAKRKKGTQEIKAF